MTTYWECTQCRNWQSGDAPPGECSNCTNADFEEVPAITETQSWSPGWDLGGFKAIVILILFLDLASIPLGPLLNSELGGIGDVVALGGIVSAFVAGGLIWAATVKSFRAWVAAVAVFVFNLLGIVVMAVAPDLLMDVTLFGQPGLVLMRTFGGLTFVEIFLLGTGHLAATIIWLVMTVVPLSMLVSGRDELYDVDV